MSVYDGKAFQITTPLPGADGLYGNGFLAPVDGSALPLKIMAAFHGFQYQLDDGSGKAENSILGPWVGKEIDEFYAKRGGKAASQDPAVAPWPGWTYRQYTTQLPAPIVGGPNPGPDIVVKPVVIPPTVPPPVVPQVPTPAPVPAAPANQQPAPSTSQHQQILAQIRRLLERLEAML